MVFPQSPNCLPSKQAVAHKKKDSPMENVFPLRTAPSQIMASQSSGRHHHVRTFFCFGEKHVSSAVFPSSFTAGSFCQRLVEFSRPAGSFFAQKSIQRLQRPDPVDELHLDPAFIRHLQLCHSG